MKRMWMAMVSVVLAVTLTSSAAYFSDDFQSGNLNNWTTAGTWNVDTYGTNDYARGVYADNDGSITHAFPGSVTGSWTLNFNYDFEWGGGIYSGDPRLILAADVLDNSNNGYRVLVSEGSWGNYTAYPSLQIYTVTAGMPSATPLASGEGFDIGGWEGLGFDSPSWKNVTLSWDNATGTLSAYTNTWYGYGCSATNNTYTSFTQIRFVGQVLGQAGVDIDDVSFVPEPATLTLIGCGMFALLRRKK